MAPDGDDVQVVVVDGRELRNDWRAKITRPIVGLALAALGVVFIAVGYWGVAHETLVAKQIPYLVSGGIGGMVLVAVGAFLLGTDDVRRQLERVERLEGMVEDLHGALLHERGTAANRPNGASSPAASTAESSDSFVALARGKSYHRAGCSMVAGKSPLPVERSDIAARRLTPCPLCTPATVVASH